MSRYLLLSTYPAATTRNVGDALITSSCIALIRTVAPDAELDVRDRAEPLGPATGNVAGIVLPGLALRPGTWPSVYPLHPRLEDLRPRLIPVGAGWKGNVGTTEAARRVRLDASTSELLARVAADSGPIGSREVLTHSVLERNGHPSVVVGDCALFDPASIGRLWHRPPRIETISFTPPRAALYLREAEAVMDVLCERAPHRILVRHGVPGAVERAVEAIAVRRGFEVVDATGSDVTRLAVHDEVDLHVGYRVHAHLYRLRHRRPSVLLEEDSRGAGFSATLSSPGIGPPARFRRVASRIGVRREGAARLASLIDAQVAGRFGCFVEVGAAIDDLFERAMLPYLRRAFG